jgi:hypothetical protein
MRLKPFTKDYLGKSEEYYDKLKEIKEEFTMKYKVNIILNIDSLL